MQDGFNALFLKSFRTEGELAQDIVSCVGGTIDQRFGYKVETPLTIFYVEKNSDYLPYFPESSPNAFLHWRICIQFELHPGYERAAYVQQISTLVLWFREEKGEKVVVACDFEDELPQG